MWISLTENGARALRAQLCKNYGLCEEGVGAAIDEWLRAGTDDVGRAIDAIFRGEGFEAPDLVDRNLWRSVRATVIAAALDVRS
ncbi:MAG: hypothetical protein E6Q88_05650 [Lysobacteraceae bacterium]|nr:MAG: hypothetical protein E6Q88_05650 [Xanthomonadaceae bacterium]